ncbi:hypothetical protein GGR56DRAFT_71574 [Xylariaceae sp. FL0804]|nr:hypothetical protein GGR56DRAFT_71574 [Xylariaceae sp. FL0804]
MGEPIATDVSCLLLQAVGCSMAASASPATAAATARVPLGPLAPPLRLGTWDVGGKAERETEEKNTTSATTTTTTTPPPLAAPPPPSQASSLSPSLASRSRAMQRHNPASEAADGAAAVLGTRVVVDASTLTPWSTASGAAYLRAKAATAAEGHQASRLVAVSLALKSSDRSALDGPAARLTVPFSKGFKGHARGFGDPCIGLSPMTGSYSRTASHDSLSLSLSHPLASHGSSSPPCASRPSLVYLGLDGIRSCGDLNDQKITIRDARQK